MGETVEIGGTMMDLTCGTEERTLQLLVAGTGALMVAWVVAGFTVEPAELVVFSEAKSSPRKVSALMRLA